MKPARNNYKIRHRRLIIFKVLFALFLIGITAFVIFHEYVNYYILDDKHHYQILSFFEIIERFDFKFFITKGWKRGLMAYFIREDPVSGLPLTLWEIDMWDYWDAAGLALLYKHSFFYLMGGYTSLFILMSVALIFLLRFFVGNASTYEPSKIVSHVLVLNLLSLLCIQRYNFYNDYFYAERINDTFHKLSCNVCPQVVITVLMSLLYLSLFYLPIKRYKALVIIYISSAISSLYIFTGLNFIETDIGAPPEAFEMGKYYAFNSTAIFCASLSLYFVLLCIVFAVLKSRVQSYFHLKIALVIGNGFDIALGLPTRYINYATSKDWPFTTDIIKRYPNHIGGYLTEKSKANSAWFDIEDLLGKYGQTSGTRDKSTEDRVQYDKLVAGLQSYLSFKNGLPDIDKESMAFRLLKEINNCFPSFHIFSFNYTNLYEILLENGIKLPEKVEHVHGSIENDNIVLGAGDYIKDISKEYIYLYKSSNERFNADYEINDLYYYDVVLFYGHSLSKVDYVYFNDLFTKLSDNNYTDEHSMVKGRPKKVHRKYVRIFTYDDDAKQSIEKNIREMNPQFTMIKHNSNFGFITTKGKDWFETGHSIEDVVEDLMKMDNHIANISKYMKKNLGEFVRFVFNMKKS